MALVPRRIFCSSSVLFGVMVLTVLSLAACNRAHPPDTSALDQAGMWATSIAALQQLNVSNAEIAELTKARQAGLSDSSCVDLIRLARSSQKPFANGRPVADLLSSGVSEQTVLELARLDQLGAWAGQAQALRLVGLSDKIIITIAQRRASGLPVLSGATLGELKNVGVSDSGILDLIRKGITDKQAADFIAQRHRSAGGHGFVYQGRRRRR